MSVRKASKKSGSRSSSSSSRRALPPSGLSGSGSGSHRGQGSLPSQHVRMANTDARLDVDVHMHDQRSMHHEQHYHDQRTQQQLNVVQVGLDPETAHAREAQVRVEALNAVAQFHQQTQEAQRVAEVSVLGAEQRVAQVQVEATVAINQLNAQHHEELSRLQQIATQANNDLTLLN